MIMVLPPAATAAASSPLPGTVGNRIQIALLATLASAIGSSPIPLVTISGTGTTLITTPLTGYIIVGGTGIPAIGTAARPSSGDTGQPLSGSIGPVHV